MSKFLRVLLKNKQTKKWGLSLFFGTVPIFMLLSGVAFAETQPVTIKASVDKSKITIGDKVNYKVVIEVKRGISVVPPDIASQLTAFEIKDYKIQEPKKTLFGKTIIRHNYILTTFTTGEYKIPPVIVRYTDKDGANKEIKSSDISIFVEGVKSTANDKDDIRDIKKPLKIRGRGLLYMGIIVLLAVAGILGWNWYQKKTLKKGLWNESGPPRPCYEVAYERLLKLNDMQLVESGKIKEYYIILSEIIRKYIEERYGISVIDRTTSEIYLEMKDAKIERKHCMLIKEFLDESDLVKFAKYNPESKIIEDDYNTAKKIIDLTKEMI